MSGRDKTWKGWTARQLRALARGYRADAINFNLYGKSLEKWLKIANDCDAVAKELDK